MAELRFPGRRRGRRSAPAEDPAAAPAEDRPPPEPPPPEPLVEIAAQVRELDAAAERAATRIADAGDQLREGQAGGGPDRSADLLAGLASALIERTDEIRAECDRLSALIERTVNLVAAGEPDPGSNGSPEASPPSRSEVG